MVLRLNASPYACSHRLRWFIRVRGFCLVFFWLFGQSKCYEIIRPFADDMLLLMNKYVTVCVIRYWNFVVSICCQRRPSDSVNRRWAKGLQSGWIAAAHLEWFPSSTMLWRRAGTGRGALLQIFVVHVTMYIQLLDLIFRYSQAPSLGEVLRASSLEARCRRWVSCSDCSSTCILQCKCVHLCTESKARRLPKPRVCRVEFLHIIVAMEAPDITQCEGAYPGLQWTWRWRLQWMGWLKCCLTSSGTFSLDWAFPQLWSWHLKIQRFCSWDDTARNRRARQRPAYLPSS